MPQSSSRRPPPAPSSSSPPAGGDSAENTFFSTIEVEELSLLGWRRILGKVGYPAGLSSAALTHDAIAAALVHQRLSSDLMDALQVNADLGTDDGRAAIFDAANDVGIDTTSWPKGETPRDLAARIWAEAQSDPRLGKAIDRALMCTTAASDGGRRYRPFGGKEPRRIADLDAAAKALRTEVLAWCKQTDRGDYAEVRKCEASGAYFFELLHGHRKEAKVIVKAKRRTTIELRLAHAEFIRYDPATGRLGVAARSREAIDFYRAALGTALFQDETFFKVGRFCTLQPIKERGRAAIERHDIDSRIIKVKLVDCLLSLGGDEDETVRLTGKDCFRTLQAKNISLNEGELLEATLEVHIDGGRRSRKKRVVLKVPDGINYRRDRDQALIDEYLRVVGIMPRGTEIEGREGFWALHPWIHSETRWRRSFGQDVDRMVKEEVLVPVTLRRAEHPDLPGEPPLLRTERLPDGDVYGISYDGDLAPRTLAPCDLSGLRLDVARLAIAIARGLGLQGRVHDIQGDASVFNLGSRDLGKLPIRVFFLARAPLLPSAVAERLNSLSAGVKAILVVPEGAAGTGLTEVELGVPCGPFERLIRSIIENGKLHAHVHAIEYAPDEARLVIDRHHAMAWLDRVPLALAADKQPFQLLLALAEARGSGVPRKKLLAQIASNGDDPEVAWRRAKKRTLDAIRASFSCAGRSVPADLDRMIAPRTGGDALTFRSYLT